MYESLNGPKEEFGSNYAALYMKLVMGEVLRSVS